MTQSGKCLLLSLNNKIKRTTDAGVYLEEEEEEEGDAIHQYWRSGWFRTVLGVSK